MTAVLTNSPRYPIYREHDTLDPHLITTEIQRKKVYDYNTRAQYKVDYTNRRIENQNKQNSLLKGIQRYCRGNKGCSGCRDVCEQIN